MDEAVSILRFHAREPIAASIELLREGAQQLIAQAEGLIGASLSQSQDDPSAMLAIQHFKSEQDLLANWDRTSRTTEFFQMEEVLSDVPNWQRFRIEDNTGVRVGDFDPGTFVSISLRNAMPGHGRDLVDDLRDVFVVLGALPGFLGGMGGRLTDLESGVVGLAFWADEASYRRSLPAKTLYKIELFRKIL